ncbi:MAG: hypothetical protein K8R85_12005 [Bacteroidetes bacterium]|nr:hypothetical protein [Bacteroidota bacterium]
MDKKVISSAHKMNGVLDDDYTLYEDGAILHFYDNHTYPGGQNIEESLTVDDLSQTIKQRLYDAAIGENKELVRTILRLA